MKPLEIKFELVPHNPGEWQIADEICRVWDRSASKGDVSPEELADELSERLARIGENLLDF